MDLYGPVWRPPVVSCTSPVVTAPGWRTERLEPLLGEEGSGSVSGRVGLRLSGRSLRVEHGGGACPRVLRRPSAQLTYEGLGPVSDTV